jgi:hypothetical protein
MADSEGQNAMAGRLPHVSKRLTFLSLMFFLSVYLITVRGYYGGDHFLSYMTAESLVRKGTLALSEQTSDVAEIHDQKERRLAKRTPGLDGRKYTYYGVALPLAMAPFYLAGHLLSKAVPSLSPDYLTMFTVSCTNAVITALTCVVFMHYARRLCFSWRTAFLLAVLYGFGTMAWNYSQYSYADPLLVLLFIAALLTLDNCRLANGISLKYAALTGMFVGLCLLTEVYSAVFIALGIGGYMLWLTGTHWRRNKRALATLLAFAGATLPAVVFLVYFNLLRFGRPISSQRVFGDFSVAFIPVALYGYLFSTGKSLFAYCPVLLISFWGLRRFAARHKAEAILFAAIVILSVLPIATWINYWNGDLAWGPRFLFHLVPMLLLPGGEVLESGQWRRWPKVSLIAVGLVTAFVQLASIMVNQGRYAAVITDNDLSDRFFTPYLSPIVGHWLLIISTIKRWLTGHSLVLQYPGRPYKGFTGGAVVNFGSYDGFDLWFFNVPAQMPGTIVVLSCLGGVLLLLAMMCYTGYLTGKQLHIDSNPGYDHG